MRNLPPLHKIYYNAGRSDKLYYFNANHLGSGSLITDGNGQTYQTLAYTPYGSQLVDIKHYSDIYNEPYRFGGKIKDEESGLNYFEARYYWNDGSIPISTDPHWYNRPHLSPYVWCANNPVMRIDPTGMDDYPVDENGNIKRDANGNAQVIKTDLPHRLAVDTRDANGNLSVNYYTLADQKNDMKSIENGEINKVVFASQHQICTLLKQSGATDFLNGLPISNLLYLYNNSDKSSPDSKEYGKLDFSFNGIPQMFEGQGAVSNPNNMNSPILFIPEGDSYAHNQMNFGNFMWGMAANFLNVPMSVALWGADYNSRRTVGEPDSVDDQLSISLGWTYRYRTK
jgi:RHS repeat-associated protein